MTGLVPPWGEGEKCPEETLSSPTPLRSLLRPHFWVPLPSPGATRQGHGKHCPWLPAGLACPHFLPQGLLTWTPEEPGEPVGALPGEVVGGRSQPTPNLRAPWLYRLSTCLRF